MKIHCLLIPVLSLTFLVSQPERKHGGEKARMLMKWKMTEFLDINEDQADKFFPKFNSFHKENKKINAEIGKLFDEVNGMIKDEKVKQNKVEKVIEEIFEMEVKKHTLRRDFMLSVDEFLSEDQQARLVVFEHRFKKRMKEEVPHFKDHFRREKRGKKHRF